MLNWKEESTSIGLKKSPSLLHNNLSGKNGHLAYVHGSDVMYLNIAAEPEIRRIQQKERRAVTQVKIATFVGKDYIIITTERGCEIWEPKSIRLIHVFSLKDELGAETDQSHTLFFCQGIATIGNDIVVGSSASSLYVLTFNQEKVVLKTSLRTSKPATVSLASNDHSLLASSDAGGEIVLWNALEQFTILQRIAPTQGSFPATSMIFFDNLLIAGFLTGHIRAYRIETGKLCFDIAAHSRSINALDVQQDCLVSVGEDTFLNVWQLPDFESKDTSDVHLRFSTRVKDALMCGVYFTHEAGIITLAYDQDYLCHWHSFLTVEKQEGGEAGEEKE